MGLETGDAGETIEPVEAANTRVCNNEEKTTRDIVSIY